MKESALRLSAFFASLLLVVLSLVAPIRQAIGGFPDGESVYRWLSLICHQLPSKSFWIFGFPCGLCSRCLAGYLGVAVAALLVFRPQQYSKRVLLGGTLLLPAMLDVAIQGATNYESANLTRALTGFFGGIGVFILCFPSRLKKYSFQGGFKNEIFT